METYLNEMISCPSEPCTCLSDVHSHLQSKILVIDDEPINAELLATVLADSGYTNVKAITDSRIALDLCRSFEPDLVLLDLMMPFVDGFAILEALGSQPPWGCLPVMVLTADENEETRVRALISGADDFILKPFDLSDALLRIERLLALRRERVQSDVSGL
jgi:DNA-binding response OmpR family regulator